MRHPGVAPVIFAALLVSCRDQHSDKPDPGQSSILLETLRIGESEGPDDYTFDDINVFTVDQTGAIYIFEVRGELKKYSPSGEFVGVIGPRGKGPGEVDYVTGLAVLPDGRLVAYDPGNRRLNIYSPDGRSIDHWPAPEGRPSYGRNALVATHHGDLYVGLNPRIPRDNTPLVFPRPTFARLGEGGQVLDTVFVPMRFTEGCPILSTSYFRAGFYEDLRGSYIPKVKWALSPLGYLVAGCPADYRFELLTPDTLGAGMA